ncbi:MoxR-like ATPase [Nitratiruptor sp. YY08-26]|uniref:AAA family ATPase n=1 Tax=unclassified Nitratiruptor TaxID=2624044 RepID=UPI001915A13D|nr:MULTISPECIES: MoxR family ATPase [unclassified Nitratiruptor]BCD63105.1 MoxR-like ATPase [Nitratiruptor sp. YY08-13]BCD67040.1 MoxR-like ATPase [Nitratiruptor sp. YY08-26]
MQIIQALKNEVKKVIVGQEEMLDAIIVALLSEGHILLEGMPGLAKTTTIKTFAHVVGLKFQRVQFTPDLLPSDIIGANIYNPAESRFYVRKGPIFTNLLLADEINRTPAKVQSALLEAMQERQVTIDKESYKLDEPFVVMATQNPIEQEGTYNLPEAQLDRFMMKIVLTYNTKDEEFEILNRAEKGFAADLEQVVKKEDLLQAKEQVSKIFIDDALKRYILDLIFATRKHPDLFYGASPRGSIDLLKAAKARAYMRGNDFVTPRDILEMAKPVLRHRVILSYEAKASGKRGDTILDEILTKVPVP